MTTNKSWFSFEAEAKTKEGGKSVDIYIFDYIGSWECSALTFIETLKGIDVDEINLHINSPGGSVFDGVAIQNSLRHHKAKVTVYIDGLAASIASIIALAGDKIKIADNAFVMIHNPASIVWGDAKDLLKEAELLDKIADALAGDYSRKMGITVTEARILMDDETWYLGQEAVDAGFADTTFQGNQATAQFRFDRVSAKAPADAVSRFFKAGNPRNTQEVIDMQKIDKKDGDVSAAVTAEKEEQVIDTVVQQPTDVSAVVEAALKVDRKRQADIRDLGQRFGFSKAAEEFAASGKSLDEFRAHILEKSPDDWRATLAIKNPATQETETANEEAADGAAAVAKIKERRQARFGGK